MHIHLDDTRIINRVEYDSSTDCFVGLCLPMKNGMPTTDAFVFNMFEKLKEAHSSTDVAKYAHCLVAKPLRVDAPSFPLFILGTDSKYTHDTIIKRWTYVKEELEKRKIKVLINGADGAGPFLKAMLIESDLFTTSNVSNIPLTWSFYLMPKLYNESLCFQDAIHLLAKLRTRLVTPSNLSVIGSRLHAEDTCCK